MLAHVDAQPLLDSLQNHVFRYPIYAAPATCNVLNRPAQRRGAFP